MFQAQDFVEITLLPDEQRFAATIRHSDGQHLLIALEPQEAALCRPGTLIQLAQPIDEGLYICDSTIINRRDNLVVAKMGFPSSCKDAEPNASSVTFQRTIKWIRHSLI